MIRNLNHLDSKKDRFKLYNQWFIDVDDEEEKPFQTLFGKTVSSEPIVVAPLAVMKAHLEVHLLFFYSPNPQPCPSS